MMLRSGSTVTVAVAGGTSLLASADAMASAVRDALASTFTVQAIAITPDGYADELLHLHASYSATVRLVTTADLDNDQDVTSAVSDAFTDAAGEIPSRVSQIIGADYQPAASGLFSWVGSLTDGLSGVATSLHTDARLLVLLVLAVFAFVVYAILWAPNTGRVARVLA